MNIPTLLQPYTTEKPDPHFWDQSLAIPVISYWSRFNVICSDSFGRNSILNGTLDKIESVVVKIFFVYPTLVLCSAVDLLIWTVKIIPAIHKGEIKHHFEALISIISLPILGLIICVMGKASTLLLKISQIDKLIREQDKTMVTTRGDRLLSLMLTKQILGGKEITDNKASVVFQLLNLARKNQNEVSAADFLKKFPEYLWSEYKNDTLLVQTLKLGNLELLNLVLNSGVDVNESTGEERDKPPILVRLADTGITYGPRLNEFIGISDFDKTTVINALLRHCKQNKKIDVKGDNFATPLVTAVVSGNAQMARLLLLYGAEFYIDDFEAIKAYRDEILTYKDVQISAEQYLSQLKEEYREHGEHLQEAYVWKGHVIQHRKKAVELWRLEKMLDQSYSPSNPELKPANEVIFKKINLKADNVYLNEIHWKDDKWNDDKLEIFFTNISRIENMPEVIQLHIARQNSIIDDITGLDSSRNAIPMSVISGYLA